MTQQFGFPRRPQIGNVILDPREAHTGWLSFVVPSRSPQIVPTSCQALPGRQGFGMATGNVVLHVHQRKTFA
jgi:hypothetical protein